VSYLTTLDSFKVEMLIDYLRRIHSNCEEAERLAHAVSMRCWKRIGEQLKEMKEDGVIVQGGDKKSSSSAMILKLTDLGITPNQSSNYQAMAATYIC
jgi:hydroxymethylpyrimidine/phosphomethylpyrimidine kinase